MTPLSRRLGEVTLVVLLAAAIVVTVTASRANPAHLPTGLELADAAQSSALYCTGFSGSAGVAPAEVVFTNTTSHPRVVRAAITSTRHTNALTTVHVAPDATARLTSRNFPGIAYYGLTALVNGGGVTATVVGTGLSHATSSCAPAGATTWNVAGLSTHVGTTTVVTVLNPTATEAIVDVSAITPTGFDEPSPFQGVIVGPHAVISLPLDQEVVDALTVAVHVHATSGTVVVATAMAWTGRVVGDASIAASPGRYSTRVFPDLPTNGGSSAEVALANATPYLETVSVHMTLGNSPLTPNASDTSAIAPFLVTLPAYTETNLAVSPSPRVPRGGPASLVVTSTGPVIAELVTHAEPGGGPWFSPPVVAGTTLAVAGSFTSLGSLLVVNRGAASVSLAVRYLRAHRRTLSVSLSVGARSVLAVGPAPGGASYEAVVISASAPVSVAGAVDGHPNGVRIVAGSAGG